MFLKYYEHIFEMSSAFDTLMAGARKGSGDSKRRRVGSSSSSSSAKSKKSASTPSSSPLSSAILAAAETAAKATLTQLGFGAAVVAAVLSKPGPLPTSDDALVDLALAVVVGSGSGSDGDGGGGGGGGGGTRKPSKLQPVERAVGRSKDESKEDEYPRAQKQQLPEPQPPQQQHEEGGGGKATVAAVEERSKPGSLLWRQRQPGVRLHCLVFLKNANARALLGSGCGGLGSLMCWATAQCNIFGFQYHC